MNASTMNNNQSQSDGDISAKKYIVIAGIIYTLLVGMYFLQRPMSRFLRNILGCSRRLDHVDPGTSIRSCVCVGALHHLMHDQHDVMMYMACDERDYRSWTVEQVVRWVEFKLIKYENVECLTMGISTQHSSSWFRGCNRLSSDYNESKGIQKTVIALRKELIDGLSLEYLKLDHLISFGIPFGIAVHLESSIGALISSHSCNRRLIVGDAARESCKRLWNGSELPLWYEGENDQDMENYHISARVSHIGEVDIKMTEGVQQIMKDQFGIPVPALRVNESINQEAIPSNMSVGKEESIHIDRSDDQYYNNGPPLINSTNFDEILKEMPPNIREVAERHPELVSRLLAEKQQRQTQFIPDIAYVTLTTASALLEPICEENCEQTHDLSEPGEEFINDEESNFDSECASLLRRRINNASSLNR
ncbi:hypothetical protein ACHAW6_000667 [Cyclotella cf. meneghiniana]